MFIALQNSQCVKLWRLCFVNTEPQSRFQRSCGNKHLTVWVMTCKYFLCFHLRILDNTAKLWTCLKPVWLLVCFGLLMMSIGQPLGPERNILTSTECIAMKLAKVIHYLYGMKCDTFLWWLHLYQAATSAVKKWSQCGSAKSCSSLNGHLRL